MSRRKGPRCFPRTRTALTLAIAAFSAVGCGRGEPRAILAALGVVDVDPPPAERVALLCDNSAGSACSRAALEGTIQAVLVHLAERPGSVIALYALGPTMADTRLVWVESLPAAPALRPRDVEAFRKERLEQARTALLEKAQPYLSRGPIGASPLLESVAKISALEPDLHHLVVVSDALEESRLGRWECGPLPDSAGLAATLKREHLIPRGSLRGTVVFAYRTLASVDGNRCPLSFTRIATIASLWTGAFESAGAARVSFVAGPPDLARDHAWLDRRPAHGAPR